VKRDPAARIVEIADRLVPCSHLAVWSEARKEDDSIDPSSVWRAMIESGRFIRESSTGHFRKA
jgi:hypothetical protein